MSDDIIKPNQEVPKWRRVLQKPSDVVDDIYVDIPTGVDPELFAAGYWHGRGSTKLIDFRYSFRMGFRKAMLERRDDQQLKYSKFKITTNDRH